MHCSRLVWNRTAEINFGLRPKFGLRLKCKTKLLVWDFSLRQKLSVTLLFALIRSQTGCFVSDQGLKLLVSAKDKVTQCIQLAAGQNMFLFSPLFIGGPCVLLLDCSGLDPPSFFSRVNTMKRDYWHAMCTCIFIFCPLVLLLSEI